MDKNPEELSDTFDHTAFGKRVTEIEANPSLFNTREQLVEFWQLAHEERKRNRSMQAYIAGMAARTVGTAAHFKHVVGNPYQDIILQFAYMDHLEYRYNDEEAEQEWDKLADMLRKLPEYRQEK